MLTRIGCFAFFFSICIVSSGAAEEPDIRRMSLKGLRSIAVVVEKIKTELEREGLSELTIRMDVELRLRQSGIAVASPDPSQGRAFLYVVISALRRQVSTLYAYFVSVS